VIAVIPARGGSRRIPKKNIKKFHDIPIIAYSIEAAEKSGLFDRIIVSTDDTSIANVARRYGAEIHVRPKALADNNIGTQEVAQDVLKTVSADPDYSCVIYATSPLLAVEDLRRGLDLLKSNRSLSYAYSTDELGSDAGCFYWGKTWSFICGDPLHENSINVPISEDRVCDINTFDDWNRALEMHKKLGGNHGS